MLDQEEFMNDFHETMENSIAYLHEKDKG